MFDEIFLSFIYINMCGIIGIKGCDDISQQIIKKLKILEYRGYDSAGICYLKNKLYCHKSIGKVERLQEKINCEFCTAIAHTRWATHGKPTLHNCHPFFSSSNNVAIVHNGIINNYVPIKKELVDNGVVFDSETDSEVIAKLFDNQKININTIRKVCNRLSGSYAIVGLTNDGIMFGAKKDSPLYVAKLKNKYILASDVACFEGAKEFFVLEDNEFVIIDKELTFFNKTKKVEKSAKKLDFNLYKYSKQYDDFMIQEILETPNIIGDYKNVKLPINVNDFERIYLFGCGSAYNCAKFGEYCLKRIGIESKAVVASEIEEEKYNFVNALCIFVSQSGETIDTLNALNFCKNQCVTLALINNELSTLARNCNIVLPIKAQKEFSVASTKAVTLTMFTLLNLINGYNNTIYKNVFEIDISAIINLAQQLSSLNSLYFVGRGVDNIINCEGALKIKEIAYINANAYLGGELKHGPLALIDDNVYVIMNCTQDKFVDKTKNTISEIKARGGKIVLFSQFTELNKYLTNEDYVINLPNINQALVPLSNLYCYQLLAYYICKDRGLNPDFPRNLAKSVTVE